MSADAAVGEKYFIGETIKYAIIVVATVPILFLYPFLQRYFVKGIMIGAVKGEKWTGYYKKKHRQICFADDNNKRILSFISRYIFVFTGTDLLYYFLLWPDVRHNYCV